MVSQYFVDFIFYSFLGWIWESFYCTIQEKEWQDRGFLFGPICPIYGFSVIIVKLLALLFPQIQNGNMPAWGIFLICSIGSAIMEYTTSWFLEKRFHMLWWDYSMMPLNLHGRICLFASVGFGVAGIVVVKWLLPTMSGVHALFPPVVYEVTALIFAGLLGIDFALTEASLSNLLKNMEDFREEFDIRAELAYAGISDKITEAKDDITEKVTGAKDGITEKVTGTKDSISGWTGKMSDAKNGISEKVVDVKELGAKYAKSLTHAQRSVLMSVKKFTKQKKGEVSIGESLKDALRRMDQ